MQTLKVVLGDLKSAAHLNGQTGRVVSGCSTNLCGEVRVRVCVEGSDFKVSVRIQNIMCSCTRDEDILAELLLQGGNPIITLSTIPSGFFMTDMGTLVLSSCSSIRGMSDQQLRQLLLNCGHVLHLSPVPVQEPGWSEVQRNLQLQCAEIMRAFGLDRLASQYARMVLNTEPTNVRALEFMKK